MRKRMKYPLKFLPCWMLLCLLTACSSSEEDADPNILPKAETTVIIYMAAENNLSSYAAQNIDTIAKASAAFNMGSNHLVAFVDKQSDIPYIASFKDGKATKDTHYICSENFISSDPEKMYEFSCSCSPRKPISRQGFSFRLIFMVAFWKSVVL